jgi:ribonucleoside-diphosphate reductase alpha chain
VGARYGTSEAAALAGRWMAIIERAAYRASADLAREKGAFLLYDAAKFLAAPNVRRLPEDVRAAIAEHGMRNGLVTSIAPTGTISLLAGNVSSGIEPVFDFRFERRVLERDGTARTEMVEDYAYALYRGMFGAEAPLTEAFVTAEQLSPRAHIEMQAALQGHVDSSISKTVNCAADIGFEAFKDIYLEAYDLGLKGCTTYRPNAITGTVLSRTRDQAAASLPAADQSKSAPPAVRRPDVSVGGDGVIRMTEPLNRGPVLEGATYKLRWPGGEHSLYITINDIEERDGRRRPFEVFINTKNLEHYAWTVALTRMISAIFRRGGDVTFVVEELKAIFDPQGGQWMGGRYVPSLIAAIGEVIEGHMVRIGFIVPPAARADDDVVKQQSVLAADGSGAPKVGGAIAGRVCPRCNVRALHHREGCWTCDSCGYSRCG